MRYLISFFILFLLVLSSCQKEGIYFDDNNINDSTTIIMCFYVYTGNEVVYEEEIYKKVDIKNIENIRDSLEEVHKDKFDYFYVKYLKGNKTDKKMN